MDDSSHTRLAAVVLAAGMSARMGGRNKLLTPYRGQPLLRHALDLVNGLDLAQRIVVTGRDADDVSRIVPAGFDVVFNSRFTDGMGSSIAAGVAAVRPELSGVLIFLADMPDIQAVDVLAVIAAFDAGSSGRMVVPVHDGERGHPVLFGAAHFAALAALDGDRGARSIVAEHQNEVAEVVASSGVVYDLDVVNDFGIG